MKTKAVRGLSTDGFLYSRRSVPRFWKQDKNLFMRGFDLIPQKMDLPPFDMNKLEARLNLSQRVTKEDMTEIVYGK